MRILSGILIGVLLTIGVLFAGVYYFNDKFEEWGWKSSSASVVATAPSISMTQVNEKVETEIAASVQPRLVELGNKLDEKVGQVEIDTAVKPLGEKVEAFEARFGSLEDRVSKLEVPLSPAADANPPAAPLPPVAEGSGEDADSLAAKRFAEAKEVCPVGTPMPDTAEPFASMTDEQFAGFLRGCESGMKRSTVWLDRFAATCSSTSLLTTSKVEAMADEQLESELEKCKSVMIPSTMPTDRLKLLKELLAEKSAEGTG